MITMDHHWLYRFRISICSNGTLYFDPKVQEYIKKHIKHLSFSISIDGNKQLHDSCRVFPDGTGSYDIAIKAVRHFRKNYRPFIGSKMTLAPSNINFLSDAVKNLINNEYTEIFLNCTYEEGWEVSHAKVLYAQLKELGDWLIKNGLYDKIYLSIFEPELFRPKNENDNTNYCGGNGEMLAIDWKGDLYPCIRYMESSLGSER